MRFFSLFVLFCSVCITLNAQPQGQTSLDEAYVQLVNSIISGNNVDATTLRLAYSRTSFYEPYGDIRLAFNDVLGAEDWLAAKQRINQLIWAGGASLVDFCHIAVTVFKALDEQDGINFFQYLGDRLLQSIYNSGDGLSEQTAWLVINAREPYFLLNSLNYRVIEADHYEGVNGAFDRLTAEDLLTGKPSIFYFNVTAMQQ